ncbi:hypothetical protein AGRHK599_LOCUS1385 [Rhizobium rhizogenes]|uniref:Uncharacterized protein n=1 Tax=Rhizobium rhizogenes TaxID=359 RepID=A0AAN2DCX4_RHIRH|nr:hypothetical protein AGRHK599_LOCUS1385 [Rhizobium rhizogenes]
MASPRNGRDAILTMGSDSPSALPARVQCNKRLRQSVAQDSDGFVTGGEVSGGCAIHGGAEVRGALPPSALPGISPSRGEIGKRPSSRFILKLQDGRDIAADRSPPLRGRCPAGQRGVKPHAPPLTFPEHAPKNPTASSRTALPNGGWLCRAIARLRFGWGWCGSDALRSRAFPECRIPQGRCTACCEMALPPRTLSAFPSSGPSLGFRHVWRPPGGTAVTIAGQEGAGKSGDDAAGSVSRPCG